MIPIRTRYIFITVPDILRRWLDKRKEVVYHAGERRGVGYSSYMYNTPKYLLLEILDTGNKLTTGA